MLPRWPGLQGILYESSFHSQLFLIFDSRKKLLGTGDAFPSPYKMAKGKFVVRLQVRHVSITILESLNDMPMCLERTLVKSIPVSFFKTQVDALIGTEKVVVRGLAKGGSISMFFKEPAFDSLPKTASSGDVFSGSVTYIKANKAVVGSGTQPNGFPIKYVLADVKPPPAATAVTLPVSSTVTNKLPVVLVGGGGGGGGEGGGRGVEVPTPASSSSAAAKISGREEKEKLSPEVAGLEAAVKEAKVKYLKSQVGSKDKAVFLSLFSRINAGLFFV